MRLRHLLALFVLVRAGAVCGAAVDPEALRVQLRTARALIADGSADRALAPLKGVLTQAAEADLAAEESAAALLMARAQSAFGGGEAARKNLARAMRRARDAGDATLAHRVALEAAELARKLGADTDAMAYVKIASEERSKLPKVKPLPPEPVVVPPHEAPFGLYSIRSMIAAFRARVKNDPEYLAGLRHLKEFRDDPATTIVGSMDYPDIPVEQKRFFKDDYKTVSEALGYYKFVIRMGKTLSDEFALATLYVNLTVLRTDDHPALEVLYASTKAAAIATAASRIIGMQVTGGAMDLTILAFDKLVIDVVRKFDNGVKPVGEVLLGDEDDW